MRRGLVEYRKFRLAMTSGTSNLWENRDSYLANEYVKYPNKPKMLRVIDRKEFSKLTMEQKNEIRTQVLSSRLTNINQVEHSCKYFIKSQALKNPKIGDMERSCGLKDIASYKDVNTGETVLNKEAGGHKNWFKVVDKAFKSYEKKVDNGSLNGWVTILSMLSKEWKRSLMGGVGPLPLPSSDEDEGSDETAEVEEDESKSKDDAGDDPKTEVNTSDVSPADGQTKRLEQFGKDPIASYDAITSQALNCHRRDVLGVNDSNETLLKFGAGVALKYDLPFIIPSKETIESLKPKADAAMIEKKKSERFQFSRRVGACLAYILAKEAPYLENCFKFMRENSKEDPPKSTSDITDVQLINYFMNVELGLGKSSEDKPEVLVEEIEKFGLEIFDLSKMVL